MIMLAVTYTVSRFPGKGRSKLKKNQSEDGLDKSTAQE